MKHAGTIGERVPSITQVLDDDQASARAEGPAHLAKEGGAIVRVADLVRGEHDQGQIERSVRQWYAFGSDSLHARIGSRERAGASERGRAIFGGVEEIEQRK